MDFNLKQILPPKNWELFEDLCLDIFREVWNDIATEKNGRKGQSQHGTDIFGYRSSSAGYHGVQCKGKELAYGSSVSIEELNEEIAKAEKFKPELKDWILATTAPRDAKIQEYARELSVKRKLDGKFPIHVFGWETIVELLGTYPSVIKKHYPEQCFDIASLIVKSEALSEDAKVLIDIFKDEHTAKSGDTLHSPWWSVEYSDTRDLGPALLGRSLGPSDAIACPHLDEVKSITDTVTTAFSVRLSGKSGSGKSVCAYQAANHFYKDGWPIFQLKNFKQGMQPKISSFTKGVFIVDNAHLINEDIITEIEHQADKEHYVILVYTDNDIFKTRQIPIFLNAKQAVHTIADYMRKNADSVLDAVKRADSHIGKNYLDTDIYQRIDLAEKSSDWPWQFCFVLGGGWKRARDFAQSTIQSKSDITLGLIALLQITYRDAQLSKNQILRFYNDLEISEKDIDTHIEWLVQHRLLVSADDIRCPHLAFATNMLNSILASQEELRRNFLIESIQKVLIDQRTPLLGIYILIDEVRLFDDVRIRDIAIKKESIHIVASRCLNISGQKELGISFFILSLIANYDKDFLLNFINENKCKILQLIDTFEYDSLNGVAGFINNLWCHDKELCKSIVSAINPEKLAKSIGVMPIEHAYGMGNLLGRLSLGVKKDWQNIFVNTLSSTDLSGIAHSLLEGETLYPYAEFCKGISSVDEELGLILINDSIEQLSALFSLDPVKVFREIGYDLLMFPLRIWDPLGVYKKNKPTFRHLAVGKKLCQKLNPIQFSKKITKATRRDLADITGLLIFCRTFLSPRKFKQTLLNVKFENIEKEIGHDWKSVDHYVEIFLVQFYEINKSAAAALIRRNINKIEEFPAKLACAFPDITASLLENDIQIRMEHAFGLSWDIASACIFNIYKKDIHLFNKLLLQHVNSIAKSLTEKQNNLYEGLDKFLYIIHEGNIDLLYEIFRQIDVKSAKDLWAMLLKSSMPTRKSISTVINYICDASADFGDISLFSHSLKKQYYKLTKYIPKYGPLNE